MHPNLFASWLVCDCRSFDLAQKVKRSYNVVVSLMGDALQNSYFAIMSRLCPTISSEGLKIVPYKLFLDRKEKSPVNFVLVDFSRGLGGPSYLHSLITFIIAFCEMKATQIPSLRRQNTLKLALNQPYIRQKTLFERILSLRTGVVYVFWHNLDSSSLRLKLCKCLLVFEISKQKGQVLKHLTCNLCNKTTYLFGSAIGVADTLPNREGLSLNNDIPLVVKERIP